MPDENINNAPITNEEQEQARKKELEIKLWNSMKPHERVLHYANKKTSEVGANMRMQISFPDIRAIKHFNGFILVIVNEKQALERAVRIATENLGPEATAEDIMKEAHRRAIKTTALPVKTFITNLRYLTQFTTNSPYYMALDSQKKTELRDIFSDAMAAIKEARYYRYHHPEEFAIENIRQEDSRLMRGEYPVKVKDFAITFGKDWKSKLGEGLLSLLDVNIYED